MIRSRSSLNNSTIRVAASNKSGLDERRSFDRLQRPEMIV
jgi:hypothetical protein